MMPVMSKRPGGASKVIRETAARAPPPPRDTSDSFSVNSLIIGLLVTFATFYGLITLRRISVATQQMKGELLQTQILMGSLAHHRDLTVRTQPPLPSIMPPKAPRVVKPRGAGDAPPAMSNSEADALSQKLRGGRNAAPSFEDLQRAAADEAQAEIERVQSGNDNVAPAIRSHRHSRADAPPRPPPPSPPRARRTPAPLPADSVGRTGDINEVAIDKMRAAATKADLAREVPWLSARPTKDSSAEPKWRIAVVTLNAKNAQKLRGQPNKRPEWMHSHSAHNKMTYCAKWGYDLIIENNDIVDKSRDVAWSKIPILKKWLPHYDYVMWIDMDAFFMRYDIPIETLIRDESRDLILSKDWHGVNFGVFILKSSAFSLELMELLWGAPRHWWEPWQEQSALMKMLDKRYVGAGAADERDRHVLYIPQRDMNAYPQHFSYGNDAAHYRDGDFIAHFPNCKAFPTCKTIMERFYQAALLFNNIEPLQGTVPDHIHPTTDPAKRANWAGANDGGNGGGGAAGEDDEAQPTPAPKTKRVAKTKRPATPPPTTTAAAEDQQQEEEDTTTTRPPRKSRKRATAVPVTMAKPVDEGDENVEQLPRADVAAAGADEAVDDAVKTKPPLQHKRGGARKTAAPSVVFDDADE